MVRLVLLHGFTQTAQSWQPIAVHLRELGVTARPLDLPCHGSCPSEYDNANLDQAGAYIISQIQPEEILVGYSLGARVALHAMLNHTSRNASRRLRVISISARLGIGDQTLRQQRVSSDEGLATRLAKMSNREYRTWLEHEWMRQELFGPTDPSCANNDIASRSNNSPIRLSMSLKNCGLGTQRDLRTRLGEHVEAIRFVVGDKDPSPARRDAFEIAHANVTVVENALHNLAWQFPQKTAQLIAALANELAQSQAN